MHFATLVALVVVASTVPSLAAPAPIPHPQVSTSREDMIILPDPLSDRSHLSPEAVQDTTKRQPVWIDGNDWVAYDSSSSNAKRQASSINEDFIILDTSNSNAKRQIDGVHIDVGQDY